MSKNSTITGKTPDQAERVLRAAESKVRRELRSVAEQLAELDKRPGKSERERARLLRQKEADEQHQKGAAAAASPAADAEKPVRVRARRRATKE